MDYKCKQTQEAIAQSKQMIAFCNNANCLNVVEQIGLITDEKEIADWVGLLCAMLPHIDEMEQNVETLVKSILGVCPKLKLSLKLQLVTIVNKTVLIRCQQSDVKEWIQMLCTSTEQAFASLE